MQLFQQGLLFTNDQKGPVHLRILLHYILGQTKGLYWGKCPSSYIVKKCPALLCTNSNASRAHSLMSGNQKDVGVPVGLNCKPGVRKKTFSSCHEVAKTDVNILKKDIKNNDKRSN